MLFAWQVGASRGIVQAGYLKALIEKKIVPDMVFGSSVGTLNACLYLQGDLDKLEQLWLTIKTSNIYTINYLNIPQLFINKNCVFNNAPLKALIDKWIDYKKIISSPIPLYIGVTNLTLGTSEVYRADEMGEEAFKKAVLASASVPLAFPAVELMPGMFYGDSGLTNNFNLRPAIAQGADKIILMSPTTKERAKTKTAGDMFSILTSIPEYGYLERELSYISKLNEYQDNIPGIKDIDVIVIKPEQPTGIELLDFEYKGRDRKALIEDARVYALSKLR